MCTRLTQSDVVAHCFSEKGQTYVTELMSQLDKLGITQLFINTRSLEILVREFALEGVFEEGFDTSFYSADAVSARMKEHFTNKYATTIFGEQNVNENNMYPLMKVTGTVLCKPENAHVLFFWFTEFVHPINELMLKYLSLAKKNREDEEIDVFGTRDYRNAWHNIDRKEDYLNGLYEEALPCGVKNNFDELEEKYKFCPEFGQFHVSKLLNMFAFDRYYEATVNRGTPTFDNYSQYIEREPRFCILRRDNFRTKKELRSHINKIFKIFVYDHICKVYGGDDIEDVIVSFDELIEKRLVWLTMMYLNVMIHVSRNEYLRVNKLLEVK